MLEREKAMTEREAEVTRRERAVKDKETVLAGQTSRYEKIIADLQKKVGELDALNDEKIEAYRKLYEKMEPKKTASLLEELDPFMAGQDTRPDEPVQGSRDHDAHVEREGQAHHRRSIW